MVTVRPIAAGETERCVELGVAAFAGQSKDQLLERRTGLVPNGVDWRQRKGAGLRGQAQPAGDDEPHICLVAEEDGVVIGFSTVRAPRSPTPAPTHHPHPSMHTSPPA